MTGQDFHLLGYIIEFQEVVLHRNLHSIDPGFSWRRPKRHPAYRAIQALQTAERPDLQLQCSLLLFLSLTARALSDSRYLDYLNQAIKLATENGFIESLACSEFELQVLPSLDIHLFRIIVSIQRGDQKALQQAIDAFGATARKFKAADLAWLHERMGIVQRMNAGELDGVSEALSMLRERAEGFSLQNVRMLCDVDAGVLLSLTSGIPPIAAEFRDRLQ